MESEQTSGKGARATWDGGIVRYDRKGRATYVIRKMVDGARYTVSTRCHDEAAAMVHYRRFEADPGEYTPGGTPRKGPVYLDDKLILDFLTHSRDVEHNSASWVHQQKAHLQWWQKKLARVDLRKAKLGANIHPALEGASSKPHRVAVLKKLYSWLRERDRLEPWEDPTFGKLQVPKNRPKEVLPFPIENFEKVRDGMADPWRSIFTVQAGTGMHATEIYRFATGGRIEEPEDGRTDGAAAIIYVPKHKSGLPYRVAVTEAVQQAAAKVLGHGAFDRMRYMKAVRAACKSVGVPNITSRLMRHTALSYAVRRGASVQAAGEYGGHSNVATTRIYSQGAPPKVPTII
jgi:integrase